MLQSRRPLKRLFGFTFPDLMHRPPQKKTNRIKAYVRVGSRTKADFDEMALEVVDIWNAIVNGGETSKDESSKLQAVFVIGEIVAGVEAGFVLPAVRSSSILQFGTEAALYRDVPSLCFLIPLRIGFHFSGVLTLRSKPGRTGRSVGSRDDARIRGESQTRSRDTEHAGGFEESGGI